jgi:hypothetical protein
VRGAAEWWVWSSRVGRRAFSCILCLWSCVLGEVRAAAEEYLVSAARYMHAQSSVISRCADCAPHFIPLCPPFSRPCPCVCDQDQVGLSLVHLLGDTETLAQTQGPQPVSLQQLCDQNKVSASVR